MAGTKNVNFRCGGCGNTKMDELHSLTEYGDRAYGMNIQGEEYCGKSFKELEKEFTITHSTLKEDDL